MMNKLISVSLAVKNKVTHGPNWLSACSLLTMLGLLVMCRPHYEVTKTSPARANMAKVTPYPVSVKLQPDTSYLVSPIYAMLTEPTQSVENCEQKSDNWRTDVIRFAMKYLGRPYRSAGKTPAGFDCSGFTGFIFSKFGYKLPSHSGSQAMVGEKVSIKEAQKGDLAFFGWKTKRGVLVNHAAIVASNPGEPLKIIHSASGKGIVVTSINQSNYWKKMLLFVRRVDLGKDTDS
jgi:cell wall-associated NlpC family hydrolase